MRYRSPDEDSARWDGFDFRPGDIVISTRSKSGTTWMQMICALLIFRTPDLPAPLTSLSPWLDWTIQPKSDVYAHLAAQPHRRFIKTHTPLDGLPLNPHATYIVVARHPLDAAVSLFHQSRNLNRTRPTTPRTPATTEIPAAPELPPRLETPATPEIPATSETPATPGGAAAPGRTDLLRWISRDVTPAVAMDSLPGFLHHATDAWQRAATSPNVLLVHYADLKADLAAEMHRIAERLDLPAPEAALVAAAGFEQMRSRATDLAPDPGGLMKDHTAFFRRGTSGAGRELLTDADHALYLDRAATLAPPEVLTWLHR